MLKFKRIAYSSALSICGRISKFFLTKILSRNPLVLSIYETYGRGLNQKLSEYNKSTLIIFLDKSTTPYQYSEILSLIRILGGKFIFHDLDNMLFRVNEFKEKIEISEFYSYRCQLGLKEWKLVSGSDICKTLYQENSLAPQYNYFLGELKYWFACFVTMPVEKFSKLFKKYEMVNSSFQDEINVTLEFIKKIHDISKMTKPVYIEKPLSIHFNKSVYDANNALIHEVKERIVLEWGAYFRNIYLAQCLEYDLMHPCLIVEIEDFLLLENSREKLKKIVSPHIDVKIFIKHLDIYFQVTTKFSHEYYQAFFRYDEFPELRAQNEMEMINMNSTYQVSMEKIPQLLFLKIVKTNLEIECSLETRELLKLDGELFHEFIWKLVQVIYFMDSLNKDVAIITFDREELLTYLEKIDLQPLSLQIFKQPKSGHVAFLERKILVEQLVPIYNLAKENLSLYEVGSGKYKSDLNNRSLKK